MRGWPSASATGGARQACHAPAGREHPAIDVAGEIRPVAALFEQGIPDVLDRVDLHPDFDPSQHYRLTLADTEMSATERAAAQATSVDDIEL